MKQIFTKCLYLLLLLGSTLPARGQAMVWERNYSDMNADEILESSIQLQPNLYVHGATFTSLSSNPQYFRYMMLLFTNAAGDSLYSRLYPNVYRGVPFSMAANEDGTFVVSGYYQDTTLNTFVGFLLKLDALGNILWQQDFGTTGELRVKRVPDGYLLTGKNGLRLIKTDLQGQVQWQRVYGNTAGGKNIIPLKDGSYLALGYNGDRGSSSPSGFFSLNHWLVKLRPNGDTIYSRIIGSPVDYEGGNQVQQTSDGGYIIAGAFVKDSTRSIRQGQLTKLDSLFNVEWKYTLRPQYGGQFSGCEFYGVQETVTGNFVIGGDWYTSIMKANGYAAILNNTGSVVWSQLYDTSNVNANNRFYKMIYEPDGSAIFCGSSAPFNATNAGLYFLKVSGLGKPYEPDFCLSPPQAQFTYRQQPDSMVFSDASVSGTRYGVVSKWEWHFGDGNSFTTYDSLEARRVAHKYNLSAAQLYGKAVTLVVTNNLGCTDSLQLYPFGGGPTGVEEAQELAGVSVYPNPASSSVNIVLPQAKGTVVLFDVSGRKLFEQKLQQKQSQVDVSQLPPGLYFYRIFTEKGVKTGKLVKE